MEESLKLLIFLFIFALAYVILKLLRKIKGWNKLVGTRPWYKDIWKAISFLALLQLVRYLIK